MNQLESGRIILIASAVLFVWGCDESRIPPRMVSLGPTTSVTGAAGNRAGSAGAVAMRPADAGMKPGKGGAKAPDPLDADAGLDDEDAGVANGKPPVKASPRDGHWLGTTSQRGRQIEFDIVAGALTFVRLSWGVFGCDGDNTNVFQTPVPLAKDGFSTTFVLAGETTVTMEGSFEDDQSASGTLEFNTEGAGIFSCGVGNATWSATREKP